MIRSMHPGLMNVGPVPGAKRPATPLRAIADASTAAPDELRRVLVVDDEGNHSARPESFSAIAWLRSGNGGFRCGCARRIGAQQVRADGVRLAHAGHDGHRTAAARACNRPRSGRSHAHRRQRRQAALRSRWLLEQWTTSPSRSSSRICSTRSTGRCTSAHAEWRNGLSTG